VLDIGTEESASDDKPIISFDVESKTAKSHGQFNQSTQLEDLISSLNLPEETSLLFKRGDTNLLKEVTDEDIQATINKDTYQTQNCILMKEFNLQSLSLIQGISQAHFYTQSIQRTN
jgi:hypothetical protein